jgi:hypothetical protein
MTPFKISPFQNKKRFYKSFLNYYFKKNSLKEVVSKTNYLIEKQLLSQVIANQLVGINNL